MRVDSLLERVRTYAMPAGVTEANGTWLRQKGEMRFGPEKPWRRFTAEQWFPGSGIDFRWKARVRVAPLISARVVDAFEKGSGLLIARVLGFITVARFEGAEADFGEAIRGLAELPWRPFAFASTSLQWQESGMGELTATFDDRKTRASVVFRVDPEGRVLGVAASRRPRTVGKTVVESPWSGVFGEYRDFNGLRVPTVAEVGWDLPEGRFLYWRGRVVEFRVRR